MLCSLSDFLQVAFEYICNEMRSDIYAFFCYVFLKYTARTGKHLKDISSHVNPVFTILYAEEGFWTRAN